MSDRLDLAPEVAEFVVVRFKEALLQRLQSGERHLVRQIWVDAQATFPDATESEMQRAALIAFELIGADIVYLATAEAPED